MSGTSCICQSSKIIQINNANKLFFYSLIAKDAYLNGSNCNLCHSNCLTCNSSTSNNCLSCDRAKAGKSCFCSPGKI